MAKLILATCKFIVLGVILNSSLPQTWHLTYQQLLMVLPTKCVPNPTSTATTIIPSGYLNTLIIDIFTSILDPFPPQGSQWSFFKHKSGHVSPLIQNLHDFLPATFLVITNPSPYSRFLGQVTCTATISISQVSFQLGKPCDPVLTNETEEEITV